MFTELSKRDIELCGVKLHPHQEQTGFGVSVLVCMNDVAVVAENKVRDRRDYALAVRASD